MYTLIVLFKQSISCHSRGELYYTYLGAGAGGVGAFGESSAQDGHVRLLRCLLRAPLLRAVATHRQGPQLLQPGLECSLPLPGAGAAVRDGAGARPLRLGPDPQRVHWSPRRASQLHGGGRPPPQGVEDQLLVRDAVARRGDRRRERQRHCDRDSRPASARVLLTAGRS